MITLSFIVVPWIDRISQVLRRISLRASRAAWHQVDRFRLCWDRWSWLCHRWTFTGSRFLTSLWHGALLFDRIRKKFPKWLQENIEKLSMLNKRRRWFHSSREKLSLVRMSASLFLVSTYLIWLWGLDTCLIVCLSADPLTGTWSSQSFPSDGTAGVSSSNCMCFLVRLHFSIAKA